MESITAHGDQAKSAHRDLILMPSLVPSSTMRGMEHGAEDISAWTSNLYYCHKEPTLGHPLGLWVSTWVTLQFALGRTDPGGGLQNSGSRLMATGEGNPAYVAGGLEGEAWGSCGHSPSPPPQLLIQWGEAKMRQGQSRGFQSVGSGAEVDCPGLS